MVWAKEIEPHFIGRKKDRRVWMGTGDPGRVWVSRLYDTGCRIWQEFEHDTGIVRFRSALGCH